MCPSFSCHWRSCSRRAGARPAGSGPASRLRSVLARGRGPDARPFAVRGPLLSCARAPHVPPAPGMARASRHGASTAVIQLAHGIFGGPVQRSSHPLFRWTVVPARRCNGRRHGDSSPHRRILAVGFVSTFALMLMPALRTSASCFSGVFLFRDPMVLCGIALGSLGWQALSNRSPPGGNHGGCLQVAVLFVAAWPFVNRALGGRPLSLPFFTARPPRPRSARGRRDCPADGTGARVRDADAHDRVRSDGLWVNTWLYSGCRSSTGTFKGCPPTTCIRVSISPSAGSGTSCDGLQSIDAGRARRRRGAGHLH